MKYFYIAVIFLSSVFNGFAQSYAYAAWTSGVPLRVIAEAGNDNARTLELLTLRELGEIVVKA